MSGKIKMVELLLNKIKKNESQLIIKKRQIRSDFCSFLDLGIINLEDSDGCTALHNGLY